MRKNLKLTAICALLEHGEFQSPLTLSSRLSPRNPYGAMMHPHCKGDAKRYACTAVQMAVKRLLQINNKAFRSNYLAGVKCVPQVLATRANVESVKRSTTEELGGAPRNPKQVRPAAP